MAATTPRVSAVIFDLDGTLLDTERATRDVLNEFLAAYGKVPDKEKEERRLGQMYRESTTGIIADYGLPLTVEEYAVAIYPLYLKRWQKAKPLPGVERLVKHLHRNGVPLALASNSVRRNIDHKLLKLKDWKDCFSVILGGDQVPRGKPSPDIFLEAAKGLGVNPSSCLVIEDSLVGVQGARASGAKVVAVPSLQSQRQHYSIADSILYSLLDFHPELWGLPPFEDRCFTNRTIILEFPDRPCNFKESSYGDCTYEYVPDQISGIFFGWAKPEAGGVSRSVISIGWDFSLRTVERVMITTEEPLKLQLVGYIRKLQSTENISQALAITDEDQAIARDALDLPVFSEHAKL
uniref:Riboflavin kinase n=1 Tax=Oryza nivara TaxID=4536 RepID=A0A0E0FTD9_ORYNI